MKHTSVLLKETVDALNVREDGIYVDGTLGRGGHAKLLLSYLKDGHLYGIDKDREALRESEANLCDYSGKYTLIYGDFRDMKNLLGGYGVERVDGVMLDLGVSSPQFDDPERGFSYRYDARLDMRMDRTQEKDAYLVVNTYSREDLTRILREYGEERFAPRIAENIVRARQEAPVETTLQLVEIIRSSLPAKVLNKKGHPAKQTFQALRIEVNDELGALEEGLREACALLKEGGRCAVITFHSLEDRMVKNVFRELTEPPYIDPKLPVKEKDLPKAEYRLPARKPVTAGEGELEENHRAHSAKLRVIERAEG
jgi:16S rRNA (cytosine1402-N4)-methyltransferase